MIVTAGTGHRPDKLGGYSRQAQVRLYKFALKTLRFVQTDSLISGMAQGWDQALAWAAKEMGIPFVAAIPFVGQERLWPQEAQDRYTSLLSYADRIETICDYNYPGAMNIRNSWMVDNCTQVLALFNGSPGGTKNCVESASYRGVPIINMWTSWENFLCKRCDVSFPADIKLTEFGCESCGKHKPICSTDKFRADGATLACGHKVCKDCWPWCEICEPVPF